MFCSGRIAPAQAITALHIQSDSKIAKSLVSQRTPPGVLNENIQGPNFLPLL